MGPSLPVTASSLRSTGLAVTATVLSCLLYAVAFPPTSLRLAAWIALAPFFVALRCVGWRGGLLLAWLWTVLASSLVADALPRAVETYFLQPKLTSYAFGVMVWSVTGAVYYMGFALVYQQLARGRPRFLPLLTGAAWAVFELLRGRLLTGSAFFTGNPWALVGYSQVGWDALTQIAALTGVYGVGFLIACCNGALAELGLDLWRHRKVRVDTIWGLAASLSLVLGALVFGVVALRQADEEVGAPAVEIAIVQANLSNDSRWRSDMYGRNLDDQLGLTQQAVAQGGPSVVFWPESAFTFFVEDEPVYQDVIRRSLMVGDVELVAGGPRMERGPQGQEVFFNSVFVLDTAGLQTTRYDKEYLVPFSEFFPLQGLELLRRRFERVRPFEHGQATQPLETRAGRAGILVCNEGMYPEVAGRRVRSGAEYLAVPSNDTWIGDAKWASRMFDLVAMRAIEQRRYLVRASTSGPSAIVDPWGRVEARSEPFSRAVVQGAIRPRSGLSVYARLGDAFTLVCALVVGFWLIRGWVSGR